MAMSVIHDFNSWKANRITTTITDSEQIGKWNTMIRHKHHRTKTETKTKNKKISEKKQNPSQWLSPHIIGNNQTLWTE